MVRSEIFSIERKKYFREGAELAELVPAKEANVKCPQVFFLMFHRIFASYEILRL